MRTSAETGGGFGRIAKHKQAVVDVKCFLVLHLFSIDFDLASKIDAVTAVVITSF